VCTYERVYIHHTKYHVMTFKMHKTHMVLCTIQATRRVWRRRMPTASRLTLGLTCGHSIVPYMGPMQGGLYMDIGAYIGGAIHGYRGLYRGAYIGGPI
jgi:hypothetical protein